MLNNEYGDAESSQQQQIVLQKLLKEAKAQLKAQFDAQLDAQQSAQTQHFSRNCCRRSQRVYSSQVVS